MSHWQAEQIGTTTVHVIGRCPVKGCRNRRRVTVVDAPIRRSQIYTWTSWKIPAADPYGEVSAGLGKGSPIHDRGGARPSKYLAVNGCAYESAWFAAVTHIGWVCAEHDRFMVTVEVKGIVNAEKPCTGACRSATGPNCECVCGGEGHGSTWG